MGKTLQEKCATIEELVRVNAEECRKLEDAAKVIEQEEQDVAGGDLRELLQKRKDERAKEQTDRSEIAALSKQISKAVRKKNAKETA